MAELVDARDLKSRDRAVFLILLSQTTLENTAETRGTKRDLQNIFGRNLAYSAPALE